MKPLSTELQEKIRVWVNTVEEDRVPRKLKTFARENKITPQTVINYKKKLKSTDDYDSLDYFRSRKAEIDAAIVNFTIKGNAAMAKILKQLTGDLVEKSEQTHKFELNADDHLRIRDEAKRRVSEVSGGANGDRGVLSEPALLLKKVREDKGLKKGDNPS